MNQPYSPQDTNLNSGYQPTRTAGEQVDMREASLSIMGEPGYSNTTVGTPSQSGKNVSFEAIQPTALNAKQTAGKVGTPQFGSYPMGATVFSADVHNSDSTLNTTYDGTDRSAKWQRPHPQDVNPLGANQYDDTGSHA